jgi:hypothetical protein
MGAVAAPRGGHRSARHFSGARFEMTSNNETSRERSLQLRAQATEVESSRGRSCAGFKFRRQRRIEPYFAFFAARVNFALSACDRFPELLNRAPEEMAR